jgi:phospholipid transport system transporter-binding protein
MAGTAGAGAGPSAGGFVAVSPSHYRLELPLRLADVPAARARGVGILEAADGAALTFDLAGVTAVDSAGLALLIDWLAVARVRGRELRYAQVPESLQALARMSDVESLLGLAAGDSSTDSGQQSK